MIYDESIPNSNKIKEFAEYLETQYRYIIDFILTNLNIDIDENSYYILNKIKIILKQGEPQKSYITSDKTIKENLIKKLNEGQLTEKVIENIFKKKNIKLDINGKYCHQNSDYAIYIYYQNIAKHCYSLDEFFIKASRTLAHELTHLIHNLIIGDKMFYDKSNTANFINESIADFTSYLYLFYQNKRQMNKNYETIAKERFDFWEEYFDTDIPYSKALYFTHQHYYNLFIDYVNCGCIKKLREVIVKNKASIAEAYELLTK